MRNIITKFKNMMIYRFPVLGAIQRETIVNETGNEMWRVGGGYNKGRPFFRIDFKNKAWRWTLEYVND